MISMKGEIKESVCKSKPEVFSTSDDNNDTSLPLFESWEGILLSLQVVNGQRNALKRVSPPSSPSLLTIMVHLQRFWVWNLSLIITLCITYLCLSIIITDSHQRLSFSCDKNNYLLILPYHTTIIKTVESYYNNIVTSKTEHIDLSLVLFKILHVLLWMFMKFLFATILLLTIRIIQRLSWFTTEFGTYMHVKRNRTYQDEALLNKAWKYGFKTCGWQDPTRYSNNNSGSSSPSQILFQARPGFCGISSFNSVLRTFDCNGCIKSSNNATNGTNKSIIDPYIQVHSLPRYVTLEEGQRFFQQVINKGIWFNNDSSSKERNVSSTSLSLSIISSVEVIGGGKNGFASYYVFKEALKQMNHPTQPARILAIFGRSPLFFCGESGVKGMIKKIAKFSAGHWSPIVSYLEEDDLVLVMDVNDTYGKRGYLIPSKRMYDAVNTRCVVTGNYRGLLLLRGLPENKNYDQTGQVHMPPPLLTKPYELSCAMGKLKDAYYRHISTSEVQKYTVDEMMNMNVDNKSKSVSMVTLEPDNDRQGCAIVSLHPMTFTNSYLLPRKENGEIDVTTVMSSNMQTMLKVFEKNRVPMSLPVRGIPDKISFNKLHQKLRSANLVQFKRGTHCMYLNLLPYDTDDKDIYQLQEKNGNRHKHKIYELNTASKSRKDENLIKEWGNVVANSYGFSPDIIRHNQTPGEFLGTAYQDVVHGQNLHQYVLCIRKDINNNDFDKVIACSTLYYNEEIQPNVACMFNVCVLKEYRGLGLGKFMSKYVIAQAQEQKYQNNIQQILLEASDKGKPVYERLGFIDSFDNLGAWYIKLSMATNDWKWKLCFWFIEKYCQFKNP